MTLEIAILFLIIAMMVIFMALEKFPTDTLAVTVMVVLIVGGFVSPAEGIAGLSNPAVVTILSLMILTIGLETTGVITSIGRRLKPLIKGKEWRTLLVLLVIVASCSALISTTAIVIVFMRILLKLSKKMPMNLSRLLIPLSFAGILGGSCTLLGTSTNLIVSAIAEENNIQEFRIFEFTPIGIIFFIAGLIYLLLVGRFLIPQRKKKGLDLIEEYEMQKYLTEVLVEEGSKIVGKRLEETQLFKDEEVDLLEIIRPGLNPYFPNEVETFRSRDILLIKSSVDKLAEIRKRNDLTLTSRQSKMNEDRLNTKDLKLCEVLVKPNSRLAGQSLNKLDIRRDYEAIPLAVKKHRRYYRSNLEALYIEPGDTLLMEILKINFQEFYNRPGLVVLQEHEHLAAKSRKRYLAGAIVFIVILIAALDITSILVSSLAGCITMFLTGCINLQKAYRRVEWNVYFLLAGLIPLGTAMDNTGASEWLADIFIEHLGSFSPSFMIAIIYLAATLLSAIISNNATAILFAPIVISIASRLSLDPRPLLLTVMFAANMSFMSPIGYQTNTIVYGVGQYRFVDFFKVGGILSIIIWILAIWLIPLFYF